jgi:hypothetical protein
LTRSTRYIIVLGAIHVVIAVCLYAVLARYGPGAESIGKGVHRIMLEDDGYYQYAGRFVRDGETLLHRRIGPGLPLVYSAIYLFPDPAHPFVRWFITTAVTILTFVVVWKLVRPHLTPAEFFVGSLVTILNPVFIHWSFKSQPDSFMGLFLVAFTCCLLKALEEKRNLYFVGAVVILAASIFFRPSVLFIPPALGIVALFARWKRLFVYAAVMLLVAYGAYDVNKRIAERGEAVSYASGVVTFVCDAYQVDEIIKQGRVEVATHNRGEEALAGPGFVAQRRTAEWMESYSRANPDATAMQAMLDFTRDNPGMVVKKTLLNPIFFFALGSREIEFWVTLVVTAVSLFFVVWGIRIIGMDRRMLVILGVIAGYIAVFAVVHGLNRYSIAVLPLLYVYAGKSLVHAAGGLRKRTLSPAS